MSDTQLSQNTQVFNVDDRQSLQKAISGADTGDTIVISKDGDYGDIRIINKSGIRLKAATKQFNVQASISIDGTSSNIVIENINLWNNNKSKRQILIIGKQSKKVIVRHCILSSFPVSMNKLRDKMEGSPKEWINGIRVLGKNCDITNNTLVNIKLGIQGSGSATTIQNNIIQYFSEDAIRANNNGVMVLKNHIYDSVASNPGEEGHRDAIQVIPPENRYNGGVIKEVEIIGNVIRSQSRGTTVPKHMQGILQGIFGSDGYFEDLTVSDNTLVLNSDHGITFNGVRNLRIHDNKVIASPTRQPFTPGIKLYLTRISSTSPHSQQWLANKQYSVFYSNNQSPVFNIPKEAYEANDLGHNRFAKTTNELAQGNQPEIIRENLKPEPTIKPSVVTNRTAPPPLPANESITDANDDGIPTVTTRVLAPTPAAAATATRDVEAAPVNRSGSVHQATNAQELNDAIRRAQPNDTIIITRSGNYGNVRIFNKSRLRIKSFNTDIPIQASFVIDGSCNLVLLENMQIWNDDLSRRYLIISGKTTQNIIVRNCILSTVRVNRTTMRRRYSGNPQQWISGIRMLGSNGQIFSNYMLNLKMAVLESGPNTLIQYNLIQFYSEDAIRASNHGVRVLHNNIYDSVSAHPGQSAHKDAIQLIPPVDRYNGGKLENVQIIGNIIQGYTLPAVVPPNQRGIVQGIFGSDGYFINTVVKGNTVMVNSDHGITLNGVRNLEVSDNRIIDLTQGDHFNPGVKLYLTRISQNGQQKWLANRPYSVRLRYNQAPTLNIPDEAYNTQDLGSNNFAQRTHHLARGNNPIIIRSGSGATGETAQPTTPVITPPTQPGGSGRVQVFPVNNPAELERAIELATSGDTILIKQPGHYGQLRLTNKAHIRVRAIDSNMPINANILIDGSSTNIIIEGMNLWFSERNWKPVVLSGPETSHITIRNCLISSTQVTRTSARIQMVGLTKDWASGIWLRGDGNEIMNNHIVNVKVGITVNGDNTLMQNNLIQYYCDTGIRAINNNMEIVHNNIYDAIAESAGSRRLLTGIQLIPPQGRFEGGAIKGMKVNNNVIQSKNSGSPTSEIMQGLLQGITLHDGYISGMVMNSNTIVVNTEHGILVNGASGLSMNGNKVFDSKPGDRFIPGIRLYYTRTIDVDGNRQQVWRTGRNYSVSFSNNHAAIFNIPDAGYEINDGSGNQFRTITRDRARGVNAIFAA